MKFRLLQLIQQLFALFGLHVRRLKKGVNTDSALEEQMRLIGPNPKLIIEIGAADGRDTLVYARRCTSAKVVAFEPLPENWNKLVEAAAQEPRIHPVNAAVSNIKGQADFHVTALGDASSLLVPADTTEPYGKYVSVNETISVEVVTLDEYMAASGDGGIDLLKTDAQGAELLILEGAKGLLGRGAVRVIFLEVQFRRIYKESHLYHQLAGYLDGFGYQLHGLYDMVHDSQGRLAWADAIFVRVD